MPSHKAQFNAANAKRQRLLTQEALSVPDGPRSKVAILMPFPQELIQDELDTREHFEAQINAYERRARERGRIPLSIMDATIEDFQDVLTDRSVSSIVVGGWGSISAINIPFSKNRSEDPRYGRYDWLHFASMADHLKQGTFTMTHCGVYRTEFNPPLGVGVVSSHANMYGYPGRLHYAGETALTQELPEQLTDVDHLTYAQIRSDYPLQQNRSVPSFVPQGIYAAARDLYNDHFNPDHSKLPAAEPLPRPDLDELRNYTVPQAAA